MSTLVTSEIRHKNNPYYRGPNGYTRIACMPQQEFDLTIYGYFRQFANVAKWIGPSSIMNIAPSLMSIMVDLISEAHEWTCHVSMDFLNSLKTEKMISKKEVLTTHWFQGLESRYYPKSESIPVGYSQVILYSKPLSVKKGIEVKSHMGIKLFFNTTDESGLKDSLGWEHPVEIQGDKFIMIEDQDGKTKYKYKFPPEHMYITWRNAINRNPSDEFNENFWKQGLLKDEQGNNIVFNLREGYKVTWKMIDTVEFHHVEETIIINHDLAPYDE